MPKASPQEIEPLLAVATATLDDGGILLQASPEFLRLLDLPDPVGKAIGHRFIRPEFHELVSAQPDAAGEVHRGLLTIGNAQAVTRTLHARIRRSGDQLSVLAEHDIVGLEKLSETLLELNRDYARVQIELAQAQLRLKQVNASLEQTVADRTAALSIARDDAEAANRAKGSFLATVGHELRTPLNSIIGFSSLLLEQGNSIPVGEQQRQLALVRAAGYRLLDVVNDMLDISIIESGDVPMNLSNVPLGRILAEVASEKRPLAESRGLRLTTALCDFPVLVRADEDRLRQVVRNLVSNAVKFTEEGTVEVRCRVEGDEARVEVVDTGIGVSQEQQLQLFEPFHRVADPQGRTRDGTGLGLSIARGLISAMGGRIGMVSDVGGGSTFWFTLPLAR